MSEARPIAFLRHAQKLGKSEKKRAEGYNNLSRKTVLYANSEP